MVIGDWRLVIENPTLTPAPAARQKIANHQSPITNGQSTIERLYRGRMGWRIALITRRLGLFSGSSQFAEPERQDLLRLLDEEIAAIKQQSDYAEKLNAEKAAIERDACLAPAGDTWRMMLRQESSLDRSIDRKVRILLAMRKEYCNPNFEEEKLEEEVRKLDAKLKRLGAPDNLAEDPDYDTMSLPDPPPPEAAGAPAPLPEKSNERTENVYENKGLQDIKAGLRAAVRERLEAESRHSSQPAGSGSGI